MNDAYDKAKESVQLNVQIEVLEDLLAIERLEIQRLKKELKQVKKLNIDDVSNCPLCESTNLHQYKLHHIHCKDCKEQFDKSCC